MIFKTKYVREFLCGTVVKDMALSLLRCGYCCGADQIPGLGTSICRGYSPKKTKKKKKIKLWWWLHNYKYNKNSLNYKEINKKLKYKKPQKTKKQIVHLRREITQSIRRHGVNGSKAKEMYDAGIIVGTDSHEGQIRFSVQRSNLRN